jgi:hypothetical protein
LQPLLAGTVVILVEIPGSRPIAATTAIGRIDEHLTGRTTSQHRVTGVTGTSRVAPTRAAH